MDNQMVARESALELDFQIKAYANEAWRNLVESCKCLKKMRDTKLYESLGYSSFGDYTFKSLNIKERQAYTYISALETHGEAFLQLNANLGITKLALLQQIPGVDREEFVAIHDLEGMTVEEVKKLVAENDQRGEQIELLSEQLEEEKSDKADYVKDLASAEAEINSLKEELEKERNKPVEVAVAEPSAELLEKIRDEEFQKATKAAEKNAKANEKALKDKFKADMDKAVADAKSEKEKELADYKSKIEAANRAVSEAAAKAEKLEKKLMVSSSESTTKFSFYFEALQSDYEKIISSLKLINEENKEAAKKYAAALNKYQEIVKESLKQFGDSV